MYLPAPMLKKFIIIRLVAAGLMIIAGAIIYLISRHDIIFFRWLPASIIAAFEEYSIASSSPLGYFIVYCLPDGLWYGALLLVQSTLTGETFTSRIIYWISIALPFIWEIMQTHRAIPGTFDPLDLCVYFLIATIFITFSRQLL